jgi:2,4-dienoyl-CoA reductase-like NADH-dependent reductase (Old Yellow Enzyme family)
LFESEGEMEIGAEPVQASEEVLGASVAYGPLTLSSRLVIAPHTVNFGFVDGRPDDSYFAYLTRRSPGFGLTWVPMAAPDPLGRAEPSQPWFWDDSYMDGLARLAEALRATGTEPGLQICHAGRQTSPTLIDGNTPVAPSPVPVRSIYKTVPRPLTVGEIAGIVEAYGRAAGRAVAAGFRAINLHFAHSYLVHQFLSPDSNHRDDEYGGTPERRRRFAREVVAAVRTAAGPDVALEVRLNGSDFVEGGLVLADSIAIGSALVADGADAINVSGGVYGSHPFNLLLPFDGQEFVGHAAAIRAATGVPVTAVGRIRTAGEAARIVAEGSADLIGVGRAVMADPDWALKALGRVRAAVRPCVGTLDGCSERLRHFEPATCQVMPEVGRELRAVPHSAPRRIAIVGGGPAGCESALYAAEQGDHVLLLESGSELGGTLRLVGVTPGGAPFDELAGFHASELVRLGVEVELGAAAGSARLAAFAPDAVVIATGARPAVPGLPYAEDAPLATDEEVLSGQTEPHGRVVVIGAGRRAIATALFCADRGASSVSMVDHDATRVAHDASALMRRAYKMQLAARGIEVVPGPVAEVTAGAVVLGGDAAGASAPSSAAGPSAVAPPAGTLPAELVVLAVRLVSVRDASNLVPAGVPVHVIGDAKEPRSVMEAIVEARDCIDSIHRAAAL